MRLVLLVALAAVHHGQAPAPCSSTAAKQALRSSGIGLAQPPDRLICFDLTRDGRIDMAVTLFSGGTAGDVRLVVFRGTASGWRVALVRGGYKLGLERVDGDLVQTQPVYRKDDPNCCPTGGFDHMRWHWNGDRFVAVRTWRDRRFRP